MNKSLSTLMFNSGSILDYIALYFLAAGAIDMFLSSKASSPHQVGFVVASVVSWFLSMPYEWKLILARVESFVYVIRLALILIVYSFA